MVSPLVLKAMTCFLSSVASGANHPKDVEAAYACILAHSGEILSMNEDDFAALQKEMTALESRACDREADRYAERHCDRDTRSERYDECYNRAYDRCERSYAGHPVQLGVDTFLGMVEDAAESLGRFIDEKSK